MTDLIYEPSHTTHWKNLFPNKMLLLGSQNLNPGEELVARIASVDIQAIKNIAGQEENVPVLTFENAPPMVLNITNSRTLALLYGENYDAWIGQNIQVFATEVKAYGGGMTTGLRIRELKPPEQTAEVLDYESTLRACSDLDQLQAAFMSLPRHIKPQLTHVKDELKLGFANVGN